jgi:alkylation response protein AidB-like acyl-CoA dehydrogenase
MFAAKGRAVGPGIARHAIDALIENASSRPARRYTVGDRLEPPKAVRDDVFVQDAVGRADTLLTSARAYLFDVMGDFWETLVNGGPPSEVQIARFSTVNAYVTGTCAEVVQLVFKAAGGSAVYAKGPFDRCLRDVLTINQHVIGTPRTYEMAGRLLLGLEPLRWLF